MTTYTKDPTAALDYGLDWAAWLDGDTISTSTWTQVPAALTFGARTHDTTSTTVWLSGGTHGQTVKVRNLIVTAAGRTDERTLVIEVRDR